MSAFQYGKPTATIQICQADGISPAVEYRAELSPVLARAILVEMTRPPTTT